MDVAFVKLILLTRCWVSMRAMIETCGFKIALRSKSIKVKSLWEQKGIWDPVTCAVACMNDVRCKTVIYSPSQMTCLGYVLSLDYYNNDLTDDDGRDNIVFRTCRVSIPHGRPCSHNDECSIQESVCFSGVCLCRPGLYFSFKPKACLKACDEYGTKMDDYRGMSIKGHNNKELHMSLKNCIRLCVEEKSFICRTLDWFDNECYLSAYGYLDVEEHDRESERRWILAQRQCK